MLARTNKRTCDNARTIALSEVESRVLRALQVRLLAPEIVAEAVETYRAGRTKAGRQHGRELATVRCKIEAVVVDAIVDRDPAKPLLAKLKALAADPRPHTPRPSVEQSARP